MLISLGLHRTKCLDWIKSILNNSMFNILAEVFLGRDGFLVQVDLVLSGKMIQWWIPSSYQAMYNRSAEVSREAFVDISM
jgi:hypothetical protein